MKTPPEELVGKRIIVRVPYDDSFHQFSGIGISKKENGQFGVECGKYDFFFDMKFWSKFDVRKLNDTDHDYLIVVKRRIDTCHT